MTDSLPCVPAPIDVLEDPSSSYWLKNALAAALTRDPVDALADAELLLKLLAQNAASAAAKSQLSLTLRQRLTGTPLQFPH